MAEKKFVHCDLAARNCLYVFDNLLLFVKKYILSICHSESLLMLLN